MQSVYIYLSTCTKRCKVGQQYDNLTESCMAPQLNGEEIESYKYILRTHRSTSNVVYA